MIFQLGDTIYVGHRNPDSLPRARGLTAQTYHMATSGLPYSDTSLFGALADFKDATLILQLSNAYFFLSYLLTVTPFRNTGLQKMSESQVVFK